eukprot:Colp12_sorted_trinity150504_noHs@2560
MADEQQPNFVSTTGAEDEEEFVELATAEVIEFDEIDDADAAADGMDDLDMEEGEGEDEEEGGAAEDQEDVRYDFAAGFFEHQDAVYCVALNPTNSEIGATGGGDDKGYIFKTSDGSPLFELKGHTDSVSAISFNHDGKYLATGGMDGTVLVWEVATGKKVCTLEGPDEVTWTSWHPRGNVVVAGAQDGSVWMWTVPTGSVMNVFAAHTAPVTAGKFTPDGKSVVTVSEDLSLILWDPKTAAPVMKLDGNQDQRFHQEAILALDVHPDSVLAITGAADNTAKIIHTKTGKVLTSLEAHEDAVETVAFANQLNLAATGGMDGKVCIWDVAAGRLRSTCTHKDGVVRVGWQADSPILVSSSVDRTVRIWDGRTGTQVRELQGHTSAIMDMALSKDGKTILTGGDDFAALVFKP